MISHSDLARSLVVLAEALVSGRRVVVVGDSSLALHELLSELGARTVHVFDPDEARALSQTPPTARGTLLRGLPPGDFDVRDGAFDLAIVPDLGSISDPAALLARLRRVLGGEGALLCAAANPDADGKSGSLTKLDYYELYDLVSLQFANVRMFATMPLEGVTMVELGQDEVDAAVRVDTQLAGERPPPSVFVALASQADVALDAYAVIELPSRAASRVAEDARSGETVAALAEAKLRAEYLEQQLRELSASRAIAGRAEEEARRALEALEVERTRASRLERDLDAARAQRVVPAPLPPPPVDDALAEEHARLQMRAAALEEGVELAEKTIVVQRDRILALEAAIADAEEQANQRVVAPPSVTLDLAEDESEVLSLESKLRERGETILALEAEVARRATLARELIARLDHEAASKSDDALGKKLDELAMLAAHQKSELEARAWRIAELERGKPSTD